MRTPHVLLALALAACASNRGNVRWDYVPEPPKGPEAQKVVEIGTAGHERILVLWDQITEVYPCCVEGGAWRAVNQKELEQLWRSVGWQKPTPRVDFEQHIVFGLISLGGSCPGQVRGLAAEPGGVLRVRGEAPATACLDDSVQRAQIIAVPKRLVRRRTVVLFYQFGGAVEFEIPGAPE